VNKHSAIFLDRDGTINEEMGYINHIERFKVFPFVAESIKNFRENGYKVIVITNQSGVAREYFTEQLLKEIHNNLNEYLIKNETKLDGIYYCPHHPTEGKGNYKLNCNCRKPKTGMIEKAVKEHNIDLNTSYIIGDRFKDMIFAKKLNMKSGFVLTGYGKGEYEHQSYTWQFMPDLIAKNLKEISLKIKVFNHKINSTG
jgi:D-glycero-D-manno-heptose 1,7-bisphosphate phosphatase